MDKHIFISSASSTHSVELFIRAKSPIYHTMVTVAIFGHSGLLGKPLTAAFAGTDATVKILYRAGSVSLHEQLRRSLLCRIRGYSNWLRWWARVDQSIDRGWHCSVCPYHLDVAVVHGLFNWIDSSSSLLGSAIHVQKKIILPAKAAGIKLFVPAKFGMAWTREDSAGISIVEAINDVEDELVKSSLPYVKFNCGAFAEFFLGKP